MKPLTDRQRQCYDAIKTSIRIWGYPPTVRDLQDEMKIASPNGVVCHLHALEKKGWIVRDESVARGLKITEPVRCPHCGEQIA